jgi:hypothetical protein
LAATECLAANIINRYLLDQDFVLVGSAGLGLPVAFALRSSLCTGLLLNTSFCSGGCSGAYFMGLGFHVFIY